jgi:DMSO/TMAO reductase YedYZ molybdopterin-dependent catalytic subunit
MPIVNRRKFLEGTGLAAVGAFAGAGAGFSGLGEAEAATLPLPAALPQGVRDNAILEALPGKKPLIKLSYRPPNYETPTEYFKDVITPNDAFFVRYHLSDIPEIDGKTWKMTVGGEGMNGRAEINLDDLKKFPAVEVTAVNQCSGNRRGLFSPHVPGVEWGYGAMGCARWKGAKLKDILDKVGLKKEALELVLEGYDGPPLDKTPNFIKSIPIWKAIEDTTIVAYEMNGQPLPHWNGFPARLVVPGWTGTYWIKHLKSLDVVTRPYEGFWMKAAYRVPLGKFPMVARFVSQETAVNTPITEIMVNSLITGPTEGAKVKAGSKIPVTGIAWDGGYGIRSVEVSADGGKTWSLATLGPDAGRYAFRTFSATLSAAGKGKQTIMARATNTIGQGQTSELILNPAGYHHNVISSVTLNVA